MSTKKETKLTPEEAEEQAFLAKQVKKPKAQTAAEGDIQPREGEEFLPPPDPPVVESPPTEPPAPDAVEDIPQKGAQPEEDAVRELELLKVGTRGEGPQPEEPPVVNPEEEE